jgi:large subunit ribosomal protein L24
MAATKQTRFAPKLKIKTGDTVLVISGADKGTEGQVLSVDPRKNKAIVEGVKIAKRHVKPTAERAGGIVDKTMPIDISNLMLVVNGTPTKVGRKLVDDKLVRYSKKTGETI